MRNGKWGNVEEGESGAGGRWGTLGAAGGGDLSGLPDFGTSPPQGACPARPGSATTLASTTAATATGTIWLSSQRVWCTTGTLSHARCGERESGSEGCSPGYWARRGVAGGVAERWGHWRVAAGAGQGTGCVGRGQDRAVLLGSAEVPAFHPSLPGVPGQHALPGADDVEASAPAPGDQSSAVQLCGGAGRDPRKTGEGQAWGNPTPP